MTLIDTQENSTQINNVKVGATELHVRKIAEELNKLIWMDFTPVTTSKPIILFGSFDPSAIILILYISRDLCR